MLFELYFVELRQWKCYFSHEKKLFSQRPRLADEANKSELLCLTNFSLERWPISEIKERIWSLL